MLSKKPTLKIALLLTIVFELIIIYLVYNKIGGERLPTQLIRLGLQITFFLILIEKPSKIILYLLTFYHVFTAISIAPDFFKVDYVGQLVFVYHIVLILLIFFNTNLDLKWFSNPTKIN